MITCDKKFLVARCHERGWALSEVMPCVVARKGDRWTIDETHPAYPNAKKPEPGGPGTELKALLKMVGITSSPTCKCNAHAKKMDVWGPDECERRLPEIVGWLKEQSDARGLPFVRIAAEQAVKLAIRRARKKASKRAAAGT